MVGRIYVTWSILMKRRYHQKSKFSGPVDVLRASSVGYLPASTRYWVWADQYVFEIKGTCFDLLFNSYACYRMTHVEMLSLSEK